MRTGEHDAKPFLQDGNNFALSSTDAAALEKSYRRKHWPNATYENGPELECWSA